MILQSLTQLELVFRTRQADLSMLALTVVTVRMVIVSVLSFSAILYIQSQGSNINVIFLFTVPSVDSQVLTPSIRCLA